MTTTILAEGIFLSRLRLGFAGIVIILPVLLSLFTCGKDSHSPTQPEPPPAPVPTTVLVTPRAVTFSSTGQTRQFNALVQDREKRVILDAVVVWTSSDPSVASVDSSGLVTAHRNGTATINAAVGGLSGQALVTVDVPVPLTIYVSPRTVNLTGVGSTAQLTAVVRDQQNRRLSDAVVVWTSGDSGIATVDSTGLVTSRGYGSAFIVATSGNLVDTAEVIVNEHPDRPVLVAFYHLTSGKDWVNDTGWLTDAPIGEWHGVTSNDAGNVIALQLAGNALRGGIPAELGKLSDLESLDLSDNDLRGSIPLAFTQLERLSSLKLQDTDLCVPDDAMLAAWLEGVEVRQLPDDCRTMENDRDALIAFYNALDGPNWNDNTGWLSTLPLDQWFGVKTNARGRVSTLEFSYNRMTGTLPVELADLDELRWLQIEFNRRITGPIPPELGRLHKLEYMLLQFNRLSGAIPKELAGLKNLIRLHVNDNRLTGTIPAELGDLYRIESLTMSGNRLSGSIPPELGRLERLVGLSLGDNPAMSGTIPPELGNLSNLKNLTLSIMGLTGPIPAELGNLRNLERIWLVGNNLSGPIPSWFAGLPQLITLNLHANQFSGSLPPELGRLDRLENLYLNDNRLSGSVPGEFAGLSSLVNLYLYNNADLSGPLPPEITGLSRLESLRLDGTRLCAPSNAAFQNWLQDVPLQRVLQCVPEMEIRAYLTQATQSLKHPVPLVGGEPALLRVFLTAEDQVDIDMPAIRAMFYVGNDSLATIDLPPPDTPLPNVINEGLLAASSNAEVPGSVIRPGLEMVIEIGPDDASDMEGPRYRIPRTGRGSVDVLDVPPLDLTLVPFLWETDPDLALLATVEGLTEEDEVFELATDLLPVQEFNLTLRDYLWTSHDLVASSRHPLLMELKAVKAMDGAGGHYMGVLRSGGGSAFQNEDTFVTELSKDSIAHELGHNVGIWHAPCGTSRGVDGFYPYDDGTIGAWGYDIRTGSLVSPGTPELMSYCGPPDWISDYHFSQAIRYRMSDTYRQRTSPAPAPVYSRVLLLWGSVDESGELAMEPAFVVHASPRLPEQPGPYRLRGEDAEGHALFSLDFAMDITADIEGGAFAFTLPVDPTWKGRLAEVTLSGPEGSAVITRSGDRAVSLLMDRATGAARGFLGEPQILTGTFRGRRLAPESGLDVTISSGIPAPGDW